MWSLQKAKKSVSHIEVEDYLTSIASLYDNINKAPLGVNTANKQDNPAHTASHNSQEDETRQHSPNNVNGNVNPKNATQNQNGQTTISDIEISENNYIKLAHWNIYGVTKTNWPLKSKIILSLDADIVEIQESHQWPNGKLELKGYEPILHNRMNINIRAKKGFGGVAFFIRNKLFESFDISTIDKEREDILGIKLVDKISEKEIVIYSAYITPHNSSAGAPASEMFTHLLTKAYEYNLSDTFLIMGDLNSRIGDREDFIEMLDPNIPKRQVIDPTYKKIPEKLF